MQNSDFSKISVNKSNRPSGFMVDLVSLAREKEERRERELAKKGVIEKGRNKISNFFKREEKLEIKNLDDLSYEEKECIFDEIENELGQNRVKNDIAMRFHSILQFFVRIYSVLFSLVKLVQRVCYGIGWIFIFACRFVFFVFLVAFKRFGALFRPKSNKELKSKSIWQEQYATMEIPVFHDFLDPSSIVESIEPEIKKETEMQGEIDMGVASTNNNIENKAVQNNCTHKYSVSEPKKNPELSFVSESHKNKALGLNYFDRFLLLLKEPYLKNSVYFALLLIVLVLPFKVLTYYGLLQDLGGRVMGASEDAIGDLKNASASANELDFYKAGEQFAEASDSFLKAQEEIDIISGKLKFFSTIIPSEKMQLAAEADNILEAAAISSKIGQQISFMFDAFSYESDKSIKTVFNTFSDNIGPIQANTSLLSEALNKMDYHNFPEEHQAPFQLLQEKSEQINQSFIELSELLTKLRIILGFESDKRYLLMYQNNSEMRGSGGFIGSFSIIDFRDGEIINIETPKGGTYDVEAGYLDRVVAPEPLHIVNPLWHFWDANWWPDWKKTARKLAWFYENSGGSSVDGVIGLTPVVAERLLEIIGPLDMEDTHGVTLTAENFWEITQTFAEEKPLGHPEYQALPYEAKASSSQEILGAEAKDPGLLPKKIIGDLIEKIKVELPKRLSKDVFLKMIASLEQSLSEKHVLFYFNDWSVQNKFEELGWAGRTKKTAWDYLMVVNSNISGAKSDRKIEQSIDHQAEVQSDGSIVDTLVIRRTHTGVKGEKFSGVRNLNWMRIYLPLGSEFVEASGFWPPDETLFEKPDPAWRHDPDLANSEENFIRDSRSWTKIYNEDDKTVFANWVQVDPGETVEIKVKYILPFKLKPSSEEEQPFALLVEKQPGAMPSAFSSRFVLNNGLIPNWHYPEALNVGELGWEIEKEINEDAFFATILK